MIEGLFDVSVDTPKHHKRGTLALKSAGQNIVIQLKLSDMDPMEFTGTCADKEFSFEGSCDFPSLCDIDFKGQGEIWGNSIDVKLETTAGKITIFGTRLSGVAGEITSSHEYLMKASKAEFDRNDGSMYAGLFSDGG